MKVVEGDRQDYWQSYVCWSNESSRTSGPRRRRGRRGRRLFLSGADELLEEQADEDQEEDDLPASEALADTIYRPNAERSGSTRHDSNATRLKRLVLSLIGTDCKRMPHEHTDVEPRNKYCCELMSDIEIE